MTLTDLVSTYDFSKNLDAIVWAFALGTGLRLVLNGRLRSLGDLRQVLGAQPFAKIVPFLAPFAFFNAVVGALGFVTASHANTGMLDVFNCAILPLVGAMLTASALSFTGDRVVTRTRRS
ncbi:MAG: hypothetical protein ACLPYS_09525 [Vulcanimicrobiaceae bacterium]